MESCCSEVDRNKYSSSLQYFNMAVDFFAEAEVDQVRMAAMLMAHSVTAWKALWLKYWSVDNASKHSPCLVQFDGKLLFGKTLKTSIQQISGGQLGGTSQERRQSFKSSSKRLYLYRPGRPFFSQWKYVNSSFPKRTKSKSNQAAKSSYKVF